MRNKTVAIVGATGAVGREFIGCIENRGSNPKSLKLLASARSAGKTAPFRGADLPIEALTEIPRRPGNKQPLVLTTP